jgi:phospholipid/cholesterol/gamma-HCH transport system ATP-binding protein
VLADQKIVALGSVAEVAAMPHPFIINFFQGERGKRALEGLKPAPRAGESVQQEI